MNCYDLTLEFIKTIEELQKAIDKKATADPLDYSWLDTDINKIELKMLEIKNILKSKSV